MAEKSMKSTSSLEIERKTYDAMLTDLEEHHHGKFVVIVGEELADTFDTFDAAAAFAKEQFGRGPYLIRRIGAPTSMSLPASVAYRSVHAAS